MVQISILHVLVLSILGGYVAVMSDQVNPTSTIPLQDYLCNRTLEFNMTVGLDDGEHRISSGPPCDISKKGNIVITGPTMKSATVRCEGEGRVFRFSSVQRFNMERMKLISCNIYLESIEITFITNCTFQNSSMTMNEESSYMYMFMTLYYTCITNCAFQSNSGLMVYGSKGNVSIINCTFQNNSHSPTYGGAVMLVLAAVNVSIANCTFQNNGAVTLDTFRGTRVVKLEGSRGDVSITNCTFQNNSATYGGAVCLVESQGDVSITNCTFHNNRATYGGAVYLFGLKGDVTITNCTFQNNSATYGDGGAVRLEGSTGDVSITNCTFQNNNATFGGAIFIFHYLY